MQVFIPLLWRYTMSLFWILLLIPPRNLLRTPRDQAGELYRPGVHPTRQLVRHIRQPMREHRAQSPKPIVVAETYKSIELPLRQMSIVEERIDLRIEARNVIVEENHSLPGCDAIRIGVRGNLCGREFVAYPHCWKTICI
jgi:hypothetical protein